MKFTTLGNRNAPAEKHSTADIGILLQPHRFYGDCGKSLHASAVAAGSDRSRTESAGHLLVLVLGLVLLREKAKCGECKEAVQ